LILCTIVWAVLGFPEKRARIMIWHSASDILTAQRNKPNSMAKCIHGNVDKPFSLRIGMVVRLTFDNFPFRNRWC
ncbi:hypothetical protein BDQ17DRAFT_1371987, partial [Cyathus striatus]